VDVPTAAAASSSTVLKATPGSCRTPEGTGYRVTAPSSADSEAPATRKSCLSFDGGTLDEREREAVGRAFLFVTSSRLQTLLHNECHSVKLQMTADTEV